MFANFLIGLREGLEAALIVAILVAYLVKLDQRSQLSRIWAGVGAAIGLSVLVTVLLVITGSALEPRAEQLFAGTMSLVAVGLITWMIFWMAVHARSLKSHLHGEVDKALVSSSWALGVVAFVAVAREGLETALFVWAAAQSSATATAPFIGALLGLAVAVALGFLLYRGVLKVDLGRLFLWTGIALIIVAAGVLMYAVHELQEAGVLPGEESVAFDVSATVPKESWYGSLLAAIFNFRAVTSWLMVVAWFAYVIPTMAYFLGLVNRKSPAPVKSAA
ncbi:MAG: FTR1 family protein [Actinomycetota bacterium]|nr:FTR1 family protein [Actinomycetota bacterium]